MTNVALNRSDTRVNAHVFHQLLTQDETLLADSAMIVAYVVVPFEMQRKRRPPTETLATYCTLGRMYGKVFVECL